MHVTVSSCTNHISRYICRQRSRFPRYGSLILIGQFKERNVELEWAAVSWGGALRDDPNNGCEGDYWQKGRKKNFYRLRIGEYTAWCPTNYKGKDHYIVQGGDFFFSTYICKNFLSMRHNILLAIFSLYILCGRLFFNVSFYICLLGDTEVWL